MTIARSNVIIEEAIAAATEPYALALSAQLEKMPSEKHWKDFRRILERSYVLVALEAIADAWAMARRSGHSRPQMFQRELEMDAGPYHDAVLAFEGRIPHLADEVTFLIKQAQDVAQAALQAEIEHGLADAISRTGIADHVLRGSFWATSTATGELMDLRSVLAGVMRGDLQGKDLREMGVSEFVTELHARGIRHLTSNRLETIYRNNLSGSYNEAAARTLEQSDVSDVIPLVMLNEIRDRRTRGNPNGLYPDRGFHWQMDGFVGTMADFRRLGILPPNGHNCRAGIRGVTAGEAISAGWMDEGGTLNAVAISRHNGPRLEIISRGDYPDPGFK